MDCMTVQHLLFDLRRGFLDDGVAALVASHLAGCRRCATVNDAYRRLDRTCRADRSLVETAIAAVRRSAPGRPGALSVLKEAVKLVRIRFKVEDLLARNSQTLAA